MGTLKRNQQREKKNNAELLEEARKSEKSMTEDATQLQVYLFQTPNQLLYSFRAQCFILAQLVQ